MKMSLTKSPIQIGFLFLSCLGLFATVCEAGNEISFKNDVMPVFMRGGCNAGDCHGAARGKDGFMLSLFGYDPEGDWFRIMEELPGRRANLSAPEQSLLLTKMAGTVNHTGGTIFKPESKYYQTVLRWLEAGAPRDGEDAPVPVRIAFEPNYVEFDRPEGRVEPTLWAHYSDGSRRDITDLAVYMSNNSSVAAIGDNAGIEAKQSGGTYVFARFDKFTTGAEVIVLPAGKFANPVQAENNYIDTLVNARLAKLRILPSDLCTDEQFLRRVTIDLTGLLPTPEEYESFMANADPDKRTHLVDDLLGRVEFGELWAAKWGEWLKIATNTNPGNGTAMKAGWNYYHWLREAMVDNLPWDRLATELVTGNGSNFRDPPSNYYTMLPVDKLDPQKLAEDTAQIFLGLRTQCAQCHNHPFDRWTMDDYYSFTSFFTGVRRKHGSEAREYYTFIDTDAEPAKHLIDGRPMPPKFLGGDLAAVKDKDARKVLADWMTDPSNALFRRNLANRIWAHFFGRGIVHPVDDVRISNPPSNEPLLEELGRRLAEDYAFDARKLVRDICLSRTYQLSPSTDESNRRDESQFSHAYLRRTRADVLFDCITQALDYQPEFRRSTAKRAVVMFEGGSRDDYNRYFFSTFGQAKRETVCTCEDVTEANLSQALHLMNGNTIDDAFSRHRNFVPGLMKQHGTTDAMIRAIYVRLLSRQPTDEERKQITGLTPDTADALPKFYESVVWALLNSSEFLFNH